LPIDLLQAVVERGHARPKRPHGRVLPDLIVSHADAALSNDLLDVLAWYAAEDPEPEQELWRERAQSGHASVDNTFNVVAIHRGAIANPDWQHDSAARPDPDPKRIADLQYRNQGSSMVAVVERLRARVPQLLADVTIQD
jgi:hypothetical protein